MFSFAVSGYVLHWDPARAAAHRVNAGALLLDSGGEEHIDASRMRLVVERADDGRRVLEVGRSYSPGPESGFQPGVAFVEETGVLFVGAGDWAGAYTVSPPMKLWEERVDVGFWGWSRHGDVVLMSAELSLAAWDTTGRKLWDTFVEPPWSFHVKEGLVHLDVMGSSSRFSLRSGPEAEPT
ncbi:hypothetical protein [Hyalangium versicolor]|uniref:hypothetical protein n=1 Tax=Hyalangium versicolor TaxID=2861190 RepID=UPI001CCA6BBB|nr:hypothetical protein [Hyalangium versicolor]